MKRIHVLLATLIFLLALPPLFGQEVVTHVSNSSSSETSPPDAIPLKVQILLTEYAGTQKLSSLPYTLYTVGSPQHSERPAAHLRLGVRFTLPSGSPYDVGTNIDCQALQMDGGRVKLDLTIDRTSVAMTGANGEESEWKPGDGGPPSNPLLRTFRDSFFLVMRDGATTEGTSAVDPISGHVLKVEVTLSILKEGETSHNISPLGN